MKLLLGFMFVCVVVGTLYERRLPKSYLLPVVGISIVLAMGYFFLRQS